MMRGNEPHDNLRKVCQAGETAEQRPQDGKSLDCLRNKGDLWLEHSEGEWRSLRRTEDAAADTLSMVLSSTFWLNTWLPR